MVLLGGAIGCPFVIITICLCFGASLPTVFLCYQRACWLCSRESPRRYCMASGGNVGSMCAIGRMIGEERWRLTTLDGVSGLTPGKGHPCTLKRPILRARWRPEHSPSSVPAQPGIHHMQGPCPSLVLVAPPESSWPHWQHRQAFAARERIAAGDKFEPWRRSASLQRLARVEHGRKRRPWPYFRDGRAQERRSRRGSRRSRGASLRGVGHSRVHHRAQHFLRHRGWSESRTERLRYGIVFNRMQHGEQSVGRAWPAMAH